MVLLFFQQLLFDEKRERSHFVIKLFKKIISKLFRKKNKTYVVFLKTSSLSQGLGKTLRNKKNKVIHENACPYDDGACLRLRRGQEEDKHSPPFLFPSSFSLFPGLKIK